MTGYIRSPQEATAILQFDDPKNISAVEKEIGLQSNTKAVLIKSRSFLENVAQKLSLQVVTFKHSRSQIFDSLSVGKSPPEGLYLLKFKNNNFFLLYSDPVGSVKEKVIKTGPQKKLADYSAQDLYLKFSKDFTNKPFPIKFAVTRMRDAVDFISNNITIKTIGKDESIMSVSMSGRDYVLITQIVNSIANNFANENSATNLDRQSGVLQVLEKRARNC